MSKKDTNASPVDITLKKWRKRRGSLIMALHEIQDQRGYIPREDAFSHDILAPAETLIYF